LPGELQAALRPGENTEGAAVKLATAYRRALPGFRWPSVTRRRGRSRRRRAHQERHNARKARLRAQDCLLHERRTL